MWFDLYWAKKSDTYAHKPWLYSGTPRKLLKPIATFCKTCHDNAIETAPSEAEVPRVMLSMFRLKQQTLIEARKAQPK